MEHGDIPASYVSLPEVMTKNKSVHKKYQTIHPEYLSVIKIYQ